MLSMAARVNQFSMQEGYGHSPKIPSPQNRFLCSVFGHFLLLQQIPVAKIIAVDELGFKFKINMSLQTQT
jgi:hypothetical protein